MPRYNQPEAGDENWNVPLNENFADLGVEVQAEVETWSDLPEPGSTERSSNGQWPLYRVAADAVFVRVTDDSREIVGGLGSSSHPLPAVNARAVRATQATVTHGRGFLSLPLHHVNYRDGLDEEEVARFSLAPSERLELWRLELKLKGGGTNPAVSVDVYDVTNDAVLGRTSDRATGGKSPVGTSGAGATIVVRVTNTSGAAQDVTISGITSVVAGTAAVDVFVAAGQSNALGRGRASRSPDVPRGAAFEYKWTEDSIVPLDDPVGEDAPPEQQATTGSLWPAFATEYYARTGRPAVYVAYSSGGSGQTPGSRMDPDRLWSRDGTLYDDARDELLAALDYLEDEGFDPTVRGCVWLQGEQDAHAIDRRIISKSEYADAFEDHIDRWQSDVQDDFRFFVLQIGHERRGDTSGYRAVRAVQSAVANRRAYVHMVSTIQTNFPAEGKMQDALHYTQEGYNEAGETAGKNTAAVLDSRRVSSSDAGVLASTDDGVLSTTTDAAFETSRRR